MPTGLWKTDIPDREKYLNLGNTRANIVPKLNGGFEGRAKARR